MGSGLDEQLEQFPFEHLDTVLVIIDTLQPVRWLDYDMTYANDYRDFSALKQLANRHSIAILLIYHLWKMKDNDPMNMISGATDSGFVPWKTKARQRRGHPLLHRAGHRVPEAEAPAERGQHLGIDGGQRSHPDINIVPLLLPQLENSAKLRKEITPRRSRTP